jgi:hypothetical protein
LRGDALPPTLAPYASAVSNLQRCEEGCFGTKNKYMPRNDICPFNGIHRVFTRCSQKTNSEGGESLEEQLLVAQLHRVKVRICAAQNARGFVNRVAFQGIGATVCDNSWRLVWKVFSRVHDFVLNINFVTDMLTIFAFFNFPNFFCHIYLLTIMNQV